MPPTNPLFLHITDTHLIPSGINQEFKEADVKVGLPGIKGRSRESVFAETLRNLAQQLSSENRKLDGVIVSGDTTHQGAAGGGMCLRNLITTELKIESSKIVVVPGNHDVARGSPPSSIERYKQFVDTWRMPESCVTPLLDGVETTSLDALVAGESSHLLSAPDGRWVVIPINSSNWCQINRDISDSLREHLSSLKAKKKTGKLLKDIENLLTVDAARVSHEQLRGLDTLLYGVPSRTLKIAVLHHHLLPVSTQEEIKPFADIVNLGLLRQFLRQHDIRIVVHGHKHCSQLYYDHIYDEQGIEPNAHRVLVVSGGTLKEKASESNEPFRLIEFRDLPHAPVCNVTSIPLKNAGIASRQQDAISKRIWEPDEAHKGPLSIYGTEVSDVYARARQIVSEEGRNRPLICTLDLATDCVKPSDLIPADYPLQDLGLETANRLEQMVNWWQLSSSKIEKRIPFIHGTRLRNYGGTFDQLENAVEVLKSNPYSSKAIAVLIDPIRDLAMAPKRGFASFCLVQFRGRSNTRVLDCVGYYRAQEFLQWWPVNIAELRHMQNYVAEKTGMLLGQVTTVAGDARVAIDSRTPTQVAVPLIDQWLDTHPERIPMMSRAIAGCQAATNCESYGMKYLKQCLDDMYMSTATFQEDGNPIAIDGIAFLIKCLDQECAKLPKVAEIISNLQFLQKVNMAFEKSGQREEFEGWKTDAQKYIEAVARQCEFRLNNV